MPQRQPALLSKRSNTGGHRVRDGILAAIVVGTCLLCYPALSLGADVSADNGVLTVVDRSGHDNDITITKVTHATGSTLIASAEVRDEAPLVPGAGCRSESLTRVVCFETITSLHVTLGDGADTVAGAPVQEGEHSPKEGSEWKTSNQTKTTWLPFPSTVDGGAGTDQIKGSAYRDLVFGGDARDLISAGPAPDAVGGGPGNDRLVGGKGGDRLNGGLGLDELIGNDGPDVFLALDGLADTLSCGPGIDDATDHDLRIDTFTNPSACESL